MQMGCAAIHVIVRVPVKSNNLAADKYIYLDPVILFHLIPRQELNAWRRVIVKNVKLCSSMCGMYLLDVSGNG